MKPMLAFLSTWLLNPHSRITDRESIQRTRLLSAILLVLMVLDSLIVVLILRADPNDITEPTVKGAIGLLGVFVVMYALNKAGHASLAAIGLILPVIGVFIYIPFFSGESPIFLVFMLIPVILTALFFPLRWTTIASFVLLTLLYLLIDQQDHSKSNLIYWNMRNLWYFLVLATGLILTFMWHSNTLESIRRQNLKRVNEELQESKDSLAEREERYRLVSTASSDFVFLTRRQPTGEFHVEWIAGAFEVITGYTFEEYVTRGEWRGILHPEDVEQDARNMAHPGENQSVVTEVRIVRKDGAVRWVRVYAHPVWDEARQRLAGIYGAVQDITERKQADEALQRRTAQLEILNEIDRAILAARAPEEIALAALTRLRRLVPCARASVSLFDFQTRIVHILALDTDYATNLHSGAEVTFETYGLEAIAALQMGEVYRIKNAPSAPPATELDRQLAREGIQSWLIIPLFYQSQLIGALNLGAAEQYPFTPAQTELAQSVADPLAVSIQQNRLQANLQQINAELEQRVAERTEELRFANDNLARAARMKDEFLASMSHELRTPLTGILAFAQTLQRPKVYGELNEKQLKAVRSVEDSGRHLLELINDILDLAKVESGKLELELSDLAVEDIAQASLRLVKQMAVNKRQSVGYSLNPLDLRVTVDVRRLKQMLVNLLSNAIKFTPEGGALGLEVVGDTDQRVVQFSVWDKGVGIAPENFSRLFQSFVQIDGSLARQQGGTGLGLALVRSMSELHGGRVSVESELGQGSRFTITLPWSVPESVTPHRSIPAAFVLPPNATWPQQALIVEDSPVAAEHLTDTLSELGIRNSVYPQGGGVVEKVAELQPGVVLLDLFLPDASGWNVLTQLKTDERTRHFPVIIISVINDRARAMQLGADEYLVKPVGRADLSGALDRVKRRLASPSTQPALVVAISPTHPHLLLAEDNEVNIQVLSDYLEASGYALTVARNGHEAVRLAHEVKPQLILMDIQMPGMDGLEATRRIRQDAALARVPIIALTALAMPGDRERCLTAGANDYLTKPVNLELLVEMIRAHLKAG